MISIQIPGFKPENIKLKHLVLDFNGTLAIDGKLIDGVKEKLNILSGQLKIHVITGNTFHTAEKELDNIPCQLIILSKNNERSEKEKFIQAIGKDSIISIGNGRNDSKMLGVSAIGIIVLQSEGLAVESLKFADIVCKDILNALDLLLKPKRLKATLRG